MSIVLKEVSNLFEAEELRKIRNECKDFMTRSTEYISEEQQASWFEKLDKENNKVYILYASEMGVIRYSIGFGYIRYEDDAALITLGLQQSSRGKGLGKTLFKMLLNIAKEKLIPVRLEVLKTNIKAFSIYNEAGFRVVEDDGKIIKMEYYYDSAI